jgi:esterase
MELFFRKTGSGDPVIILHGLYGSSDNWHSVGRELAGTHTVYLVDQRNHGRSPHDPLHTYEVLSNDLNEFMVNHQLDKAVIIGHSMGGKTAMTFGLNYPDRISRLIVVDISPLAYHTDQRTSERVILTQITEALQLMEPDLITSREHADKQLARFISSPRIRQFLLKNLKRTSDGRFKWAMNIQALAAHMDAIFEGINNMGISDTSTLLQFPVLFIKGELSGYIGPHDEEAIYHYFPQAKLVTIPRSGHWVHAEQPEAFLKAVQDFIK